MMIRPVFFLTLGLTLALGCGRSDRPTVRQTTMGPKDKSGEGTAATPAQTPDDFHPGSSLPKRARPKRTVPADVKPADAVHAKPGEAKESKRLEGEPADAGDAKTAKAAKMPAATAASAASAKPAGAGGAAPPKAGGRDTAKVDSKEVRIGGMTLAAPKNWMRERPAIGFILAQFSLPRAAGDKADAQLTVTAPGEHDPKAVERAREQLKEKPEEGTVEHLQIAGNEVVLVDSTGDYGEESEEEENDPASPPAHEGRYRALNAMIFLGGKLYIVNCTGPEKTVTERAAEFREFLQSMKPADPP